jgi:hypothetical protein
MGEYSKFLYFICHFKIIYLTPVLLVSLLRKKLGKFLAFLHLVFIIIANNIELIKRGVNLIQWQVLTGMILQLKIKISF